MRESKKIAVRVKVDQIGNVPNLVDSLLNGTVVPELVFLDLNPIEFPNRILNFPEEVKKYVMTHPNVKTFWGDQQPFEANDGYEVVYVEDGREISRDFIEKNITFKPHEYIDMTMVSVFYDAGINELRKVATRKAVSHWIEQSHLPNEMMFIELGFNGVFTFSREDFPEQIDYIRIDGNDSHKYLFQKEHLWNIAAKRAKYEKLMFVDSDIAPLEDVDWFKQVYEALDKCLFTQGFYSITYLDENDKHTVCKQSYTSLILQGQEKVSSSTSVPGGTYCIKKSTLKQMNYFNYLPFGGGDNLFWSEFYLHQHRNICIRLCKRDWVLDTIIEQKTQMNIPVLGQVYVDVVHFYHGNMKRRSHTQRHFMALTQFPWLDSVISEDQNGLLCWIEVGNQFYNAMSKLNEVNDDKNVAAIVLGPGLDYLHFIEEVRSLQTKNNQNLDRISLVRKIYELKKKFSK